MAETATRVTTSGSALARFAQKWPLTVFFVLAYIWTWSLWLVVARVVPDGDMPPRIELLFEVLSTAAISGPTLAAFATSWLAYRNLKICRLWTGWRGLLQGLGFGLTAFILVTLIAPTRAIVQAPLSAWHWSILLHWGTYQVNFSTFFGGPVNEEPGWRGFALPRLQARYGPVWATLILAPLWAGWHTPLFWMQGWTSAKPWEFLLILVGISFLFTAAANISKFNILVAMALHTFFNTSSRLGNSLSAGLLPRRPHEMVIYTFVVLAGGVAIGLAALGVRGKPTEVMEPVSASARQFAES